MLPPSTPHHRGPHLTPTEACLHPYHCHPSLHPSRGSDRQAYSEGTDRELQVLCTHPGDNERLTADSDLTVSCSCCSPTPESRGVLGGSGCRGCDSGLDPDTENDTDSDSDTSLTKPSIGPGGLGCMKCDSKLHPDTENDTESDSETSLTNPTLGPEGRLGEGPGCRSCDRGLNPELSDSRVLPCSHTDSHTDSHSHSETDSDNKSHSHSHTATNTTHLLKLTTGYTDETHFQVPPSCPNCPGGSGDPGDDSHSHSHSHTDSPLYKPTIGYYSDDTDSDLQVSPSCPPCPGGYPGDGRNVSAQVLGPRRRCNSSVNPDSSDTDSDFQVSPSCPGGSRDVNTQVSGTPWRRVGGIHTYYCLAVFMLTLHSVNANGGLIGGDRPCSVPDGAPVHIEGITSHPCYSCYCKGGVVNCSSSKKECETTRGPCPFEPIAKLKQQCCDCQGCIHKGVFHESGSTWTDAKKHCKQYTCEAGVVTGYKVECHVICKHPVFPSDSCCPVCEGCRVDGVTYKNHDTFTSPNDPSAICTCKDGSVSCERRACPVLNCRLSNLVSQSGTGSCPQCKKSRKLYKPKKGCFFRSGVLRERERVTPEPCTNCLCLNNTVVCVRRVCPSLHCGSDDVIRDPDDCCPRCKRKKKPCRLKGKTYKHGATWWPDECTSCACDDNTVRCHVQQCHNKVDCPKGQRLSHTQGRCCPVCVDSDAVCAVFGDPHYRTFDGLIYNFQGTCRYVLAQDCHAGNFSIRVRNAVRMTNDFAWTKSVSIVLQKDLRISLHQNLRVKVNGKLTSLPYEKPHVAAVVKGGRSVTLKTTFGLKVIWDGDSYLEVTVPPHMKNKMCGLCGNYNGIQSDDFTGKDGGLYLDANEFAETWRLGKGRGCGKKFKSPHKVLRQQSLCDNNPRRRRRAEAECSILHSLAFTRCRVKVDVGPYYMSCVVDVCDCPKGRQCSCEAITAYSRQCTREGVPVSWRTPSTCGANPCPKGAVFNVCASACPRTCANIDEPTSCDKPCAPACQCPHGKVLKGKRCVHRNKCPQRTWSRKMFGLLSRS